MMNEKMFENWGSKGLEMMIKDYDETPMPLPSVETEPQLLISKVRKHYMEHMIQLLSNNYETHQKLLGKNIYLPSAIWRCAKYIELNAAQTCMVVELYRRNIIAVVKQLKADTKKGKLNRMLLECLQKAPVNEKKLQATLGKQSNCTCQCTCNGTAQKKRKLSTSPRKSLTETDVNVSNSQVLNTSHSQTPADNRSYNITITSNEISQMYPPQNKPCAETPAVCQPAINPSSKILPIPRISIESQDSEDQVMLQLEQLFRADCNEIEDDLFESTLFETVDTNDHHDNVLNILNASVETPVKSDEQAAKIKSLDERLALLESSGVLVTTNAPKTDTAELEKSSGEPPQKKKKTSQAKWICELYYQRMYLFEKLDDIRESNRKKHSRIKGKFLELFGDDSDNEDDQIMSPLEETPEFILSCKERIAPWIVKLLTPYYVNGRIRGKALFKAVAKHLIRLIYQCSRYPSQFEVTSFVTDFLKSHKMIRCEADFKEFRIDNI